MVLSSLSQIANLTDGVLFGLIFVAGVIIVWMVVTIRSLSRRFDVTLRGADGARLESQLAEHQRERETYRHALLDLNQRVETLERELRASKRHLGIVRYDAYEGVAGSQSFAMAILDDDGNGGVLSSLVGRTDCRVYGKPLQSGEGDRALSDEEREAVRQASQKRR